MTEFDLSTYRDRTYNRLVKTFDMGHEEANFVIAYATHVHRDDLEAALDSIHEFLNSRGI